MPWTGDISNPSPNNIQYGSSVSEINKSENRALNIRRDKDSDKDFSVRLIDIDAAILSHLNNTVDLHVLDNGESVKVPVLYASQEKWKAIQKDGFLRDQQGKIQLPLLVFSRTSFNKNSNLMTLNRHLSYSVLKKFNEKNQYNKFSILNNSVAPTNQVLSVTLPDHIDVSYDFICHCEYIEQLNTIIQKINFACEEYWGDPKRFKFRVYSEGYSFSMENSADVDRLCKSTFTLKVKAYLLEDSFESRESTTKKILTPKSIKIGTEVVTGAQMSEIESQLKKSSYKKPKDYTLENSVMVPDGETFSKPKINVTSKVSDVSDLEAEKIKGFYENLITKTMLESEGITIWHDPPANSNSYGEEGWMAYDGSYHYVYVNGSWKRHAISHWTNDF